MFIEKNLRYPTIAQENGISGTVIINFVVDRDGKITGIKVVRSIGGGCDDEAVSVLSIMPAWNAGKQGGMAVRLSFRVPVKFVLQ